MFFEEKIITKDWGKIDPRKITDYLEVGGYAALEKFTEQSQPEKFLEEVKLSGLCGRGGAGFPTGIKWSLVAAQVGEKYFICNLDESEPGTYKDRELVGKNPHLLLEGLILASLTVGAKIAYIYLNGHYQAEKKILEHALQEARKKHFWGKGICGSSCQLEIVLFCGAGAYVCGEETALINSIEGKRGEPKLRPPYPTEMGLFGRPTVINNAETLASLPWIFLRGGKNFSQIGSSKSPGTKLFVLGGAVKNKGVFEAPTGSTIYELIYTFGGGMSKGKQFWFAQIGGASGRLILENELLERLDYAREAKISLGSGSILVVDKTANLQDLLLSWSSFFRRESCGKCVPCREGTFRLQEIAERLEDGKISERDKEALLDILWTLENTTFCPLGKFAATAWRDAVEKLSILEPDGKKID